MGQEQQRQSAAMQMQNTQNAANLQQQGYKETSAMAMNYNRTQAYQNGPDPYSGWGDGGGGDAAAGAAVGMLGGLALGSAIDSVPRQAEPVYPPAGTTNNYYYSNGNYMASAPIRRIPGCAAAYGSVASITSCRRIAGDYQRHAIFLL
jgi:hypothetical protein